MKRHFAFRAVQRGWGRFGEIMNNLYRQFSKPEGFVGWLAGLVMSFRASNRLRNKWTVDQLKIQDGAEILEIGFGPGLAIQRITEKFPNCKITGVDHSDVMVRMATRNNHECVNNGQVKLFCGGLDSLRNFEKFDRIYALNSHMFWPDLKMALRQIVEHLNSGGLLGLTYQPRGAGASNEKSISEAEALSKVMAEVGLVDVKTVRLELSPYVHCVLGKKR